MRLRAGISAALASGAILLAAWQAGSHVADSNASAVTTSAAGTAGGTSTGSTPNGAAAKAAGTYTGTAVETRFGTVQVQVTIKAGAITDVTALHLTDQEQRSVQISARAAPLLRSEVLSAQSANVQTIGGATYTSEAYLTSLQAALDAAHF